MNLRALKEYLVMENGAVNYEASQQKLIKDLQEFEAQNNQEYEMASQYVHNVFESNKGSRLATDFVISQAFINSGEPASKFPVLTEVFRDYIKANTGEKDTALFGMGKGKGGGIWRWSDVTDTK